MTDKKPRGWTEGELELYRDCKAYVSSSEPQLTNPKMGESLLALIKDVFQRAHHKDVNALRKSAELERLIRLCACNAFFPPGTTFAEKRTRQLCEIMLHSPQRPVQETAVLVLLTVQYREHWPASMVIRKYVKKQLKASEQWVLPMFVLARELELMSGDEQYDALRQMTLDQKRMRLAELVRVVNLYDEDAEAVTTLVEQTFEAIFDGLDDLDRDVLSKALFKAMSHGVHVQWQVLMTPMLLQNRGNAQVLNRVLSLMEHWSVERCQPYLIYYAQALEHRDWDAQFFVFARRRGTVPLLAALHPHARSTFLGVLTPTARKVQGVIDEILAREGVDLDSIGGLSVAHVGGGELSVANAHEGALSLDPATTRRANQSTPEDGGALVVRSKSRSIWGRMWSWLKGLWGR